MFGKESRHKEVRFRIVIEAVLHKDRYLNEEYLTIGAKQQTKWPLLMVYATYSGSYGCETLSKKGKNQKAAETLHKDIAQIVYEKESHYYQFLGSG